MRKKVKTIRNNKEVGNFAEGSVAKNIMDIALPIIISELVHVTYNLVDRVFLGHINGIGVSALTSVGVTLPVITVIIAVASLFGTGGMPLCSIARGEKDTDRAKAIVETCFTLLLISSVVLTLVLYLIRKPILLMIGADSSTLPYALEYLDVYLIGTVFVLISLGMNPFINSQGYSKVGMCTVLIGAVLNLILDPILIFTLDMGIRGAAIATVVSQFFSALWVVYFMLKRSPLRVKKLRVDLQLTKQILKLGITGFTFKVTNSIIQAVINSTLHRFGGAASVLYLGTMSIINPLREVLIQPVSGITSASQSVMSFNYGAKLYSRVCRCIRFMLSASLSYNFVVYLLLMLFAPQIAGVFSEDIELITLASRCIRIYFSAFFLNALQLTGQNTYVALNKPKLAVFYSLLKKVFLTVPFTILLPLTSIGVDGVFYAEAISQVIGSFACFSTMVVLIWRKLAQAEDCSEQRVI